MNPEQEIRLQQIFRDNQNKGIAIAITGCWGVGKTFAWNKFRNRYLLRKKYVYVSLFGLESLSDLKTHIYSHIENNNSPIEIPRWLRGLPSILKETKISQFGISTSANIIDSLMFNQVKDAVICFDDFERMSKKLDITDVMGLANQLKLERNCQVILILDEEKGEGNNRKKYAEYKEKLIDEEIKITSVEPLIRENTKEIDELLVNLIVKFANELEIHNFRFFQKVIKLYQKFLAELPHSIATSTKEVILIRILQGYFIQDFGEACEYSWSDVQYINDEKRKNWSIKKIEVHERLTQFSYKFIYADEWFLSFRKWFNQTNDFNISQISELANSDLISEKNNTNALKFHKTLLKIWNLEADEKFPLQLYEITKNVIGVESLSNISFAINLLELFNEDHKVIELEGLTLKWIDSEINKNSRSFDLCYGELRENFNSFITEYKASNKNLPPLKSAIFNLCVKGGWNTSDTLSIETANKAEWINVLFYEIAKDAEFGSINSSYIVKKILQGHMSLEFKSKFRKMIIEIYEEEGRKSDFHKNYMSFLISRLDN